MQTTENETQMEPHDLPDALLDQRVTQARAELTRLSLGFKMADAEVRLASNAFEEQPDGERFQAKAVAEQKARNARSRHDAYAAESAGLIAEADRRSRMARLEELRAATSKWPQSCEQTAAEIVRLHEAFTAALTRQLKQFETEHVAYAAMCAEQGLLELSLSTGQSIQAQTFVRAFCVVRDQLEAQLGKPEHAWTSGSATMTYDEHKRHVRQEVHFQLPRRDDK